MTTTMRKKKSCSGCRALGHGCELGYQIRHHATQPWKAPVPLEPCPKPLTYDDYFAERDRQRRLNNSVVRPVTS